MESRGGGRILANTAFRAIADIGAKIASTALYVVLARKVGDSRFGVYSYSLAFAGLATTLGSFGQDSILTREVARDHRRLEDYFANTMALRVVIALPVLLLALAIAAATGMSAQALTVTLLLGLGLTADLLSSTCFAVFQSYERLEFVAVVLLAQRWLTAAAGIGALLAGAGIETVAGIYLAGAALAAALGFALVRTRIERPRFSVDVARWKPLMAAAVPVGIVTVALTVLARIDTALLAVFKPDDVVGRYGAAYRVYESTLFVGWAGAAALLPVLSRLRPGGDQSLGLVFERGLKLVLALSLPLTAATLVLAEPIIRTLFGSSFAGGAGAARILAPGMTLAAVSYLTGHLLIAQDRQRALVPIYAIVAAENIAANFVLVPLLSLEGAALNTVVSEAIIVIALLAHAVRLTGPYRVVRIATGPLLAAALAAGVMLLLRDTFAAAAAAGAVTYVAALLAFERLVFPEDAQQLRGLLVRRRA